MKKLLIGAHTSIAGGFCKSIDRAIDIKANTMQIFTKSNRQWKSKPLDKLEVIRFKKKLKESGLSDIVVHASYLINIGSMNEETEKKSMDGLKDELQRCEDLGIKYLVLHPGAHLGNGIDDCLKKISKNLDKVFEAVKGTSIICIENMAGQGTTVGFKFEHLKQIYDLVENKSRIGICLDTCHMFAAGYDISTEDGYKNSMKDFEDIIGFDLLKVIHVNDSKKECNCRVDRHESLGDGKIKIEMFKWMMNDDRLKGIPMILETPYEEKYSEEIEMLKSFVKKRERDSEDEKDSKKIKNE
eukprot:gene10707-3329_t